MSNKDAIATVLNRNAFYRDGYRLMLRLCLVLAAVIAVLVMCIGSLIFSARTQNVYFATTADGRILSLVPIGEPYRSDADVITWAAKTSRDVMGFGYHDYKDHLTNAAANFTTTGWESFSRALKESSLVDSVRDRKMIVSLEVQAAPEIKSKGLSNGAYAWYLKFPIKIKFSGEQTPPDITTNLVLKVVRVSTLTNPEGISIEQWVTISGSDKR